MRVAFLVHELRRSGGFDVVAGHADRLRGHEIDAELVVTGPDPEPHAEVDVPVRALAEAGEYDVAVATWWETAWRLWDVEAARRAVFLQSMEHRFYPPEAPFERMGAATVYSLPVTYIAISNWIDDLLAELRPDAPCFLVPNGIDKDVFGGRERARRDGPLRILVEGQPTLPFKGVAEALAAVDAMQRPSEASMAALEPGSAPPGVRALGGLGAAEMADLYAQTDVVLKLSRVEGLGLGPIEAFHVGVPCVVTPYTGHEDYVRDGENGIVVPFDDTPAAAEALDRLAADRDLLERLREGALATAAEWPSTSESTKRLAAALGTIAREPAPDPGPAIRSLLRDLRLGTEVGRSRHDAVRWALAGAEAEHQRRIETLQARLDRITGLPPYRAAAAARRIAKGLRR